MKVFTDTKEFIGKAYDVKVKDKREYLLLKNSSLEEEFIALDTILKIEILTPDGNIWVCCDFVDLSYHNISDENIIDIQDPIIGNIKIDSMETILERKREHAIKIKNMRFKDAVEGKLKNGREIMCDNCKFYHFNKIT